MLVHNEGTQANTSNNARSSANYIADCDRATVSSRDLSTHEISNNNLRGNGFKERG